MKNQVFKGEALSRTKVKNRIIRLFNETNEEERFDWYQDANDFALKISLSNPKVNHSQVIGIISALSPVKTWSQNKACAVSFIENGEHKHMKQFGDKAQRILESDGTDESILSILNGRKISAFYMNIKYPQHGANVTIDRHALSIALGRWVTDLEYSGMTAKQYIFFQNCYILASEQAKVTPLIMQSSTWVKFRKIKGTYKTNR
tara:strand:+ start:924 stop:1535 length:612 start_codon:yes stop_codon:yes gene_type:complete